MRLQLGDGGCVEVDGAALVGFGSATFLDGGQLDLGIIRDSALSAQNKFQNFYECFEAVAQLAPFSYRVTISLCADGASQAASAVNVCSPQGS